MPAESSRQEWEEGYRRIQAERDDRRRYRALMADVDSVRDDLRRRVGQTFTIAELAATYQRADAWVHDAVSEHAATPGWPRYVAMVEDAAFYLYQRGAADYVP